MAAQVYKHEIEFDRCGFASSYHVWEILTDGTRRRALAFCPPLGRKVPAYFSSEERAKAFVAEQVSA